MFSRDRSTVAKYQMPTFRNHWTNKLTTPGATLGMGLAVALMLTFLPGRYTVPIRDAAAKLFSPGQRAAAGLRQRVGRATVRVKSHFQGAARLAETQRELTRLRQENRLLAAELRAARVQPSTPSADTTDNHDQLLRTRSLPARVLGRQARAYLARHHLLDVGSAVGVELDSLVLAAPALIDQGRDADVRPGQLVLNGRRVWGKIVELGSRISAVRALTEPGYRDLIAVGSPTGPQGILEGTGESLTRIRLVAATEPISVGDPVYAAAGRGVICAPLLYGRIARLEQPVGNHWEIWMQPAVPEQPQRVAVLQIELNPLRVAEHAMATRE